MAKTTNYAKGLISKKRDVSPGDELKIEREMLEVALKYKKFLRMPE